MRHVYVHIPFCARRCSYCDFAIAVRRLVPSARYVDLVLAEYDMRRAQDTWEHGPIETLYLGGGTPSMLAPDQLARLVRTILESETPAAHAQRPAPREVTIEANPDDVTPDIAESWAQSGITRVSVGAQSFDPEVLAWMHRTHDPESIERAVAALRKAELSFSLDVIFARPEGREGQSERDLDRAVALAPDHLSAYGLTVEPRTALARWVQRGLLKPANDERYANEFVRVHDRLTAAGFEHYEVSNYARPGHRARHNSAYWTGRPYVGLGPSAHSYQNGRRSWNIREWAAYERVMAGGGDPTAGEEVLTPEQQELERIYLGLRTADGLPITAAPAASAASAAAKGWLEVTESRIRATVEGWLRLDSLTTVLTTSAESG